MSPGYYPRHNIKLTVEQLAKNHCISLSVLQRWRFIEPGANRCRFGNQDIGVVWVRQHLGGARPWLVCPECSRRCGKLYTFKGMSCRKCLDLTYRSTRETYHHTLIRRADAIRMRLGWPPGIVHPLGDKPAEMKMRAFIKLIWRYQALVDEALAITAKVCRLHRLQPNLIE